MILRRLQREIHPLGQVLVHPFLPAAGHPEQRVHPEHIHVAHAALRIIVLACESDRVRHVRDLGQARVVEGQNLEPVWRRMSQYNVDGFLVRLLVHGDRLDHSKVLGDQLEEVSDVEKHVNEVLVADEVLDVGRRIEGTEERDLLAVALQEARNLVRD